MPRENVNQEEILNYCNEYFSYDLVKGGLTYKKRRCGMPHTSVGQRVGNLHPSGYRNVKIRGRYFGEHVLVFLMHNGKFPEDELDHIDRLKDNNKIENLRECTRSDNCSNRSGWSKASKYKGVYPSKRGKPWEAAITVDGKSVSLGTYLTEIEAAVAFDKAVMLKNPVFCKTNFDKENYVSNESSVCG